MCRDMDISYQHVDQLTGGREAGETNTCCWRHNGLPTKGQGMAERKRERGSLTFCFLNCVLVTEAYSFCEKASGCNFIKHTFFSECIFQ